MFKLAVIDDTTKVQASQLGLDTVSALTYNINAKYANRILPNVGLCISHFDYLDISEGHLQNGDGCTYYKTTFRLIVFRPFKGEVLTAKVKSSDARSIRLTMGFFDDIYIPKEALPQPSAYDHHSAAFFWLSTEDPLLFEDPFSSIEDDRFIFYQGEVVRFMVDSDEFHEPEPPGPASWGKKAIAAAATATATSAATTTNATSNTTASATTAQGGVKEVTEVEQAKRLAPYRIVGSMTGTGLAVTRWWTQAEEQEMQ